jgi:hypothetical protein
MSGEDGEWGARERTPVRSGGGLLRAFVVQIAKAGLHWNRRSGCLQGMLALDTRNRQSDSLQALRKGRKRMCFAARLRENVLCERDFAGRFRGVFQKGMKISEKSLGV